MIPNSGESTQVEVTPTEALAQKGESRSRRNLLKALGVAAAGAVAGGVLSPGVAEAHGTLHVDSNNSDPAIHGNNTADGPGLEGTGVTGPGVHGLSNAVAVEGECGPGIGVHGVTDSGFAVKAEAFNGTGVKVDVSSGTGMRVDVTEGVGVTAHTLGSGNAVEGFGHNGIGVRAFSMGGTALNAESQIGDAIVAFAGANGTGVRARSAFGSGVEGVSDGLGIGVSGICGEGTALYGRSSLGTALEVVGTAKFSTAGSGIIPASQDSAFVDNAAVTAKSHVTVTLTGSPGIPSAGSLPTILWVDRQPGTGFVLHMTRKVGPATPFTYLIVEPE
jgi:hypothetical protein